MRRRGLLFGAAIAVGVLLIAELAVRAVRFEGARAFVERELGELLGLEVEIAGSFQLELLPRPQLEATDVLVASPSGRASPHLLRVGALQLEIDLWRLLAGAVAIEGLNFVDAELRIEPDRRGHLGLDPDLSALDAHAEDDPLELELRQLEVSRLRIFYQQSRDAPVHSLWIGEASLTRAAGGMELEMHGELEGNRFTLDGELGPLPGLLSPTQPYPIELRLSTEHATLSASGSVARPLELEGIDVALDGRVHDLDGFVFPGPLPALGPISVSARLRDEDGVLGLRDIVIATEPGAPVRARLAGSLRDLMALAGVSLALRFETPDLARSRVWPDQALPDLGPVLATATLIDADGSLGLEGFALEGGRAGRLSFRASGEIDDLRELDQVDFEASLEARDMAVLGALLGIDLPPVGPVEASGSFRGSAERLTSRGALRLDATRLRGSWSASFPDGRRPAVRARLESEHVYLDDLGIFPGRRPGERSPANLAAQARGGGAEPDPALPFASLHALDLDLVIHADLLTGRREFAVRDAELRVGLEAGALHAHLGGNYERGALRVAFDADAGGTRPELGLRIDARGVDLTSLLSQVEEETDFAGIFDADVELRSRGRTRDELAAALEGRVRIVGREGTLVSRYAQEFVRDFARVVFPAFRRPRKAAVPCLVLDLAISDGVATVDSLLLDAGHVVVRGEGHIYLAGDRYALRLVPRVRDPGLVSVAAAVDVSGPLAAPSFRAVLGTIASSAARALFTNARKSAETVLAPIPGLRGVFGRSAPLESCPQLPALAPG